MNTHNTGGPAFPCNLTDDSLHIPGMTMRDYFAAKAMAALVSAKGRRLNWRSA